MSRLKTDAIRNVNASVDGITLDTSGNVAIPNELQLADKIVHTGDTNTAIRFPSADVITAETSGTERIRVTSGGLVLLGSSTSDLSGNHSFISIGSRHALQYGASAGTYLSFIMGSANGNVTLETSARSGNYPPLLFELGGSERLRIDSSGKVGIGLTNPTAKLQIKGVGGTNGVGILTTDASGNNVFWTHDGGKVGLHYNPLVINQDIDSTDCPSGSYFYVHHASHPFLIKNDGKVGIGDTSPDCRLHVNSGAADDALKIESTDASVNLILRDSVCTSLIQQNNTTLMIGSDSANTTAGSIIAFYVDGTEQARIANGISFNGDTSTSNMLNDYEEGTFTITVGTTGNAPTISGTSSWTGQYTKIGKVVHVNGYIASVNVTNAGTGSTKISGLPFASAGDYCAIAITHNDLTAHDCEGGYIGASQSHFFPIQPGSTSGSAPTTGFKFMMFAGTYLTDA